MRKLRLLSKRATLLKQVIMRKLISLEVPKQRVKIGLPLSKKAKKKKQA